VSAPAASYRPKWAATAAGRMAGGMY